MLEWCLLGLAFVFTACNNPPDSDRFFCGYQLDSDPRVVRSCTMPGERCVCALHACAQMSAPLDKPDMSSCMTGYVYREYPFAPSAREKTCVTPDELATALPAGSRDTCPDAPRFDLAVSVDQSAPGDLLMSIADGGTP